MTNKERIETLLIEFDELGMEPTLTVPNPVERASEWKHEMAYSIRHLRAEVAREIFEDIERILLLNKVCSDSGIYYEHDVEWDIADLKKKYTEEQT